jgi:phage anti-repressor protein
MEAAAWFAFNLIAKQGSVEKGIYGMIEVIRREERERQARKLAIIAARNVAFHDELMHTVASIIEAVRTRD